MNRRCFVSGAGLALATPLAGCLSTADGDEDPEGTEDLPVRFWLEEVSLSASKQESVDPIVFEELSAEEREIVRTTLEEGEYTVEHGSESPALSDLRDRIEQRTGGGETLEAYLRRTDTYYGIGFSDGDHIIANPDQ